MSTRLFRILAACCGILGVIMIITSFAINPGLGSNPTVAQLIAFKQQYYYTIVIGGWLQAVGSFLCVLFAFAIVHLASATTRFAGWVTLSGGTILVMVSLIEVAFYFSAVNGNPATTGLISLDLIRSVQQLYSIIAAPVIFFPLGVVILGSRVLPRLYGYGALVLGGAFAILGVAILFSPIQNIVNYLSVVQGFWWLFAAITLLVRAWKISDMVSMQEQSA